MANKGKQFESSFKQNWKECFPNTLIYRFPDQLSGFKTTSKNPADFFAFNNHKLWFLECKETKEGTLNFSKVSQLDTLESYLNYEDVKCFIIIWFSSFDKIVAVEAKEALRLKNDLNKKSISLKMLNDDNYKVYEVPSTKKRVFLTADYSFLLTLEEND